MLRTKALLIALVAASVDAANLRASESRRLAGHGGHDDGELAKVREVDPHLGRGQPAAIGVAEASSRPIVPRSIASRSVSCFPGLLVSYSR